MSDLFTSQEQTKAYFVTRDNKDKIRCVNTYYSNTNNIYYIHRITYQYGGKQTEQPIITIDSGKVNRDTHAQCILRFLAICKEYKDKGYKEIDSPAETLDIETLSDIIGEYKTDSSGIYKPMLAKQSSKVTNTKIFDKLWVASRKIDGCFKGNTLISTNQGLIRIDKIVNEKLKIKVLSYNEGTKKLEYKPVINWFNNGTASPKDFIKIKVGDSRYLTCTKNHKFYNGNNWEEIKDSNIIYKKEIPTKKLYSLLMGTLLGDSCLSFDYRAKLSFRLICSHKELSFLQQVIEVLGLEGKYKNYISGYGSSCWRFDSCALTNSIDYTKFYYKNSDNKYERFLYTAEYLNDILDDSGVSLWIADDGSISYNNEHKDTPILTISTEGWEYDQIIEFQRFFKLKYDIPVDLITDKRKVSETQSGIKLKFRTKYTLKLLNILKYHKFKTVEYKYYYDDGEYEKANLQLFSTIPEKNKVTSTAKIQKFDIEVADNHNYFAEGFLVHNCRCLMYWDGKHIKSASRGGGNYNYATEELRSNKNFIKLFEANPTLILDGELYKHGWPLQKISGAARLEKNAVDCDQLEYYVYDYISLTKTFKERLKVLNKIKQILNLKFDPTREWAKGELKVQMVPQVAIKGWDNIINLHNQYVEEGWEGVVIRDPNRVYKPGGRTNDMIKVKMYKDSEFLVKDYELGLRGSEDIVFICETPSGKLFKAKPMGTREDKKEYIRDFNSKYKNHLATVKYFYYSDGNDVINGVPLQPCLKAFRDNDDM